MPASVIDRVSELLAHFVPRSNLISRPLWSPLLVALIAGTLLVGCGNDAARSTSYSGIVVASEFTVGINRFPFGLVSRDGQMLRDASVDVSFVFLGPDGDREYPSAPAIYRASETQTPHEHADGQIHMHIDFQGVYTIDAYRFETPGVWEARFEARLDNGQKVKTIPAGFMVELRGSAPARGDSIPPSENLTIQEREFEALSTRSVETDDMHRVSVKAALETDEPFVVFFASPRFCVSAICGPVTEIMDQARSALGGRIPFIHIEPWDLEKAKSNGEMVPSDTMAEWNLKTEPWTFVIDRHGKVATRFEGFVTIDEVITAVQDLL